MNERWSNNGCNWCVHYEIVLVQVSGKFATQIMLTFTFMSELFNQIMTFPPLDFDLGHGLGIDLYLITTNTDCYEDFLVTDLGGHSRCVPPPHGPKFSQFHAVFCKIWQNHMLAPLLEGWRPLLREILDPPLLPYSQQDESSYLFCNSILEDGLENKGTLIGLCVLNFIQKHVSGCVKVGYLNFYENN